MLLETTKGRQPSWVGHMKRIARIYTLVDPVNGKVFYVGQTISSLSSRLSSHVRDVKKNPQWAKSKRIRKIMDAGLRPLIYEVATLQDFTKQELRDTEQAWIDFYKLGHKGVTNLADSTSGGSGTRRTVDWTDEVIALLGKIPDQELADQLGCDRKTVEYRRKVLGISKCGNRTRSNPPDMGGWNVIDLPDNVVSKLGTMPDYKLGEMFGYCKSVIARHRRRLGITSYGKMTGNDGKYKPGNQPARWKDRRG